jgi:hypothetical protein
MAFSILITNVDDHLHNHGFLHAERGLWRPEGRALGMSERVLEVFAEAFEHPDRAAARR